MKILVLNFGSSTAKSQLIDTDPELIAQNNDRLLAKVTVDRMGTPYSVVNVQAPGKTPGKKRIKISKPIYKAEDAVQAIIDAYLSYLPDELRGPEDIEGIGHRVVHGGERFQTSTIMTEEVVDDIEETVDLAPLHNPHNLKGYYAAKALLPHAKHVAVFDTSFHQSMPPHAYLYGLPYLYYERYKIRRYGFHGTSHRYISYRYARIHGQTREAYKLITCHLGNGCSLCAVDQGRSIDTSMGFTPLEGLLMGTRCGDVDPMAVFYVLAHEEVDAQGLESLLNRMSGLYGVSGISSDMRILLEEMAKGSGRAKLAIDMFCYRARKYIGSYMAALNGCDAILFGGGIGENSPPVRQMICDGLKGLGVEIDAERNANAIGIEAQISTENSRTPVWVIPTNEELLIARDTLRCILGLPLP
ncbi:MAG: acetate kinase [Bryobacterales bacterium]|nr:acetate kinase [Bryobacterales bacterium]